MAERNYQKGEYVVYGSSGVCLIEEIGDFSFSNGEPLRCYFTLRPISDPGSVIYLPRDNDILFSRLRPVLTKEEIREILTSHLKRPVEWDDNRKQRSASFRDMLAKGDLGELLSMIRCICLKTRELTANKRKLSTADQEALQGAKRIVRGEFSFSLGIRPDEVTDYIRSVLGTEAVI